MPRTVLFTRPNSDLALRYLYSWSQELIKVAQKKGATVLDLDKKKANRIQVEKMIKKNDPDLIVLNGHGNYNLITGQNLEVLVESGVNHEVLSDSVVYAISCRSAGILGESVVKKGNRAYIGYREDFIFYYDETKIYRPLNDKKAKLFLDPSNQIVISLLKNHSAKEASDSSKRYFMKSIQKLLTSDNKSLENSQFISALYWNFKNQVCLGNGDAKI